MGHLGDGTEQVEPLMSSDELRCAEGLWRRFGGVVGLEALLAQAPEMLREIHQAETRRDAVASVMVS